MFVCTDINDYYNAIIIHMQTIKNAENGILAKLAISNEEEKKENYPKVSDVLLHCYLLLFVSL